MKRKRVFGVCSLLWCMVIFYQSSKIAEVSSGESSKIMEGVNYGIRMLFGLKEWAVSEVFIRKLGHFLEYTLLGFLLYGAMESGDKKAKGRRIPLWIGILYAVTDEVHQYFVPGRSMRIFDVGIDAVGVFAGIILAGYFLKNKGAIRGRGFKVRP